MSDPYSGGFFVAVRQTRIGPCSPNGTFAPVLPSHDIFDKQSPPVLTLPWRARVLIPKQHQLSCQRWRPCAIGQYLASVYHDRALRESSSWRVDA